jgi:GalNAc-alpha-(1->4)-GalNAc-alpha-(1->3)-diNAcBac-PP-undecaprenol alpha-1,4-N-acetyl-D-galactosaminyltransferase
MTENVCCKNKYLFIIPRMGNGGAERVMATLANELSNRDNEVLILSLTTNESFYDLNDSVQIIGAGYEVSRKNKIIRSINMIVNGIKGLFYIRRTIKEWNPNTVVSFLTHTNILSLITKIFYPGMKLIVSERCDPWERSLPIRVITKYLYPLADGIVCQSEVVSEFFPKYSRNKIRVIKNPINVESISNRNFTEKRKAIISVGRLFEQKNFALLIDSFNDIKDEFPEHILEIYGEGHLREQLQNQIKNLGLVNRVFLKGVKNNVMKFVSDSEIFVMSSNYEGFPNALIEAMASGMPVVSTDFSTGVARDLIKKDNGIVVPVGDRDSMRKAIRTILSDKELQKRMSVENRKIKNTLSVEMVLNNWIELFKKVNEE